MKPKSRYHKTRLGPGVTRSTHLVVWERAHGPVPEGYDVDHINGDKHDNRLENLRLATRSQNLMNTGLRKDNQSGLKGLAWDIQTERWRAHVTVNRKQKSKRFTCKLDAVAWLYRTRAELHGEFARNM